MLIDSQLHTIVAYHFYNIYTTLTGNMPTHLRKVLPYLSLNWGRLFNV